MASRSGPRILVGTADGLHTLGGRTAPQLAGHEVRNLSSDGRAWWAIVDRQQIYTRAQGSRWKRMFTLPAGQPEPLEALCLLPTPDALFVGTSRAQLLRSDGGEPGPVASFANHADRDHWHTPWGGPPDTRSLARGDDGAIYVNVHVGGVLRSRDAGRTWRPIIDSDSDVHQIVAQPGRAKHLYAATAIGLAVSRDGGARWSYETDGLHANYCRAVTVARDRLLVTASHGPGGRQGAVYWRPLKGRRPMSKCITGLPQWFDGNVDTFCIDASGAFVAFGTDDGTVYASEDQGDSWHRIGSGLPAVRCVRVVAGKNV